MTDATGAITDDGVICRMADTHFFSRQRRRVSKPWCGQCISGTRNGSSTSTSRYVSAAPPRSNLAGPMSRAILGALCRDVDLRTEAFPYMAVRAGHVAEVPARILRVGFVGELGYEIHVPSGCGNILGPIGGDGRPMGPAAVRRRGATRAASGERPRHHRARYRWPDQPAGNRDGPRAARLIRFLLAPRP